VKRFACIRNGVLGFVSNIPEEDEKMKKSLALVALAAVMGLSACNSTLERGLVGAAIGCVAGEVLVNGRCVEGAVVGGGVGVLTR
jgi:hypothetical protein